MEILQGLQFIQELFFFQIFVLVWASVAVSWGGKGFFIVHFCGGSLRTPGLADKEIQFSTTQPVLVQMNLILGSLFQSYLSTVQHWGKIFLVTVITIKLKGGYIKTLLQSTYNFFSKNGFQSLRSQERIWCGLGHHRGHQATKYM